MRSGWLALVSLAVINCYGQQSTSWIDEYNVVWDSPSQNPYESMPIGNGDIGLNVWIEEAGDLLFYISKTDSWSENNRLLKLGRIRVKLTPNPFREGLPFCQELKLRQGEIVVTAGRDESQVELRIWVDAHHPVVNVEAHCEQKLTVEASLETWRNEQREPVPWMRHDKIPRTTSIGDAFNVLPHEEPHTPPGKMIVYPDVVVDGLTDQVMGYHHNKSSIWPLSMKLQGLESLMPNMVDPLLHRTFGGLIVGHGFESDGARTLRCKQPAREIRFSVYVLTKHPATVQAWKKALLDSAAVIEQLDYTDRRVARRQWWTEFWQRSWIDASGSEAAETVSRGYTLQRYMNACAGRGAYPIKFNGSIFTVEDPVRGAGDPDYRRWGPGYWFQNTRLIYWPMMASGDFDLMRAFFNMYRDALPLARERTRIYYGHGGAFFGETVYSWGVYANDHYGWKRDGKPLDYVVCPQIERYWQGGLELSALMLDYYAHTQDETFARDTMLPVIEAVLDFYDQHYPRDPDGRLRIKPAQALETWLSAENPTPEVAGLRRVVGQALLLPEELVGGETRNKWTDLRQILPPIPLRSSATRHIDKRDREFTFPAQNNLPALAPAEIFTSKSNIETPELYAVFPYRLYGIGKPDIDLAKRAYVNTIHPASRYNRGWQQFPIWAARLGLTDAASELILARATNTHKQSRFPAMWGPNYDWIPDQDNGGVLLHGFQSMLMQCDGKVIRLFPAWPREWDVRFKLHAPHETAVEGELKNGDLIALEVTPNKRRSDLVVMLKENEDTTGR